jgi:hypothetical protein
MNEGNYGHPGNEGPERDRVLQGHRPYWKRAHRDWRVWVGVFFMLAAMTIYLFSEDLSFFGSRPKQQPMSDAKGL